MKRCPTCGRELHESATACDACEAWAASLVATAPVEETPASPGPQPVAAVQPAAPPDAAEHLARRREMTLVAVGVAGAALVTFALLFARGVPASNVSAAAATAAARPAAAPAPVAPAATQTWSTDNQMHWLGANRRGAAFELPAENIVKTWFGPIRPTLVVRCIGRTTQAFVYTGSPLRIEPNAEGKTVSVSMDGQPATTERWPDSDDHDALFAPDGAAFAQHLLQIQTLRVGYSPHNASDVVAEFRVSGLDALIGSHPKECGWAK